MSCKLRNSSPLRLSHLNLIFHNEPQHERISCWIHRGHSDRTFSLHTWSGRTNKSKPVRVSRWCISHLLFWITHIKCVYHWRCTVKIHSRCSRRLSLVLIEKSCKSLKLKFKVVLPPPPRSSNLKFAEKRVQRTHFYTYICMCFPGGQVQDVVWGQAAGRTRGTAPAPPAPPGRPSAAASRAAHRAGGSARYLTQPRRPSARLGFHRRHLTTAQARRHEQFKRFFFFHGLGGLRAATS